MANRIVGNIYIIDSGLQNLSYINHKLLAVGFYGANSASTMTLTMVSSTLDAIVAFANITAGSASWADYAQLGGVYVSDTIRVLNLVAGTGWLYMG